MRVSYLFCSKAEFCRIFAESFNMIRGNFTCLDTLVARQQKWQNWSSSRTRLSSRETTASAMPSPSQPLSTADPKEKAKVGLGHLYGSTTSGCKGTKKLLA
ncbi:hypothetical protein Adt_04069 [Abeliophyllum distichum]|uniref:Uncharacterized protein n=1 Tax=Abeliophyllum distichum TaxID=126358 RepID=A0ABD1W0A5_9LAMI